MERGFEFLDKELSELHPQPDEEKDSRFADKLVKVFHCDGVEEWVLLHVEVQDDTYDRAGFAERMYTYFYRIRDRYHKPVSAAKRDHQIAAFLFDIIPAASMAVFFARACRG